MSTIQLTTFKGCQPTVDIRNELEELIDKEGQLILLLGVLVLDKGRTPLPSCSA